MRKRLQRVNGAQSPHVDLTHKAAASSEDRPQSHRDFFYIIQVGLGYCRTFLPQDICIIVIFYNYYYQ